jgi:hypothetical protein
MKRKWMGLTICMLLGMGAAAVAAHAAKDVIQVQTTLDGANAGAAESNLGDLVADAVRQTGNADIALVAADEITDASIPAGSVPPAQIVKTLRYADDATDTVVVLTLTGAQIRKAVERGVSRAPQPFNGFLQVSGLQVRVSGDDKKITLSGGGGELSDKKTYRVATTRPIADGSLGYFQIWSKSDIAENTGQSVAQSLANYLASHKTLNVAVEGRITTG